MNRCLGWNVTNTIGSKGLQEMLWLHKWESNSRRGGVGGQEDFVRYWYSGGLWKMWNGSPKREEVVCMSWTSNRKEQHEQTRDAWGWFMALSFGLQSTVANPAVYIPWRWNRALRNRVFSKVCVVAQVARWVRTQALKPDFPGLVLALNLFSSWHRLFS